MTGERRIRCFLDVDVGAGNICRIVLELFNDICPKTCENFRALCTGEFGLGKTTNKPLNFKGTIFHRVIKGFMIQGGDTSGASGRGGESIYGGLFEDENFNRSHDRPFLLSMANRGVNTNGSQFFITTAPAPHLDSRNVVFGQVISGEDVVITVESVPVDRVSRPLTDIKIVKSGELVLSTKTKLKRKISVKESESSSSSVSSDSSSEDEEHSKLKKKQKKQKDKSRDKKDTKEKEKIHPLVSLTPINAEDIPAVPVNRLLRDAAPRNGSDRGDGKERERDHSRNPRDRSQNRIDKDRRDRHPERSKFLRGVTKSGRNIKGRGVFRYRTPSRSRSRSATPPHWKQAQSRTIKMSDFKQKTKQQLEWASQIVDRGVLSRRAQPPGTVEGNSYKTKTGQEERTGRKEASQFDSQSSGIPKTQKSSTSLKVQIKDDPLSDLEEGETRDEDTGLKVENASSPCRSSTLDYNACDFEPGLEPRDQSGTTGDNSSPTKKHELWDSKRRPEGENEEDTEEAVADNQQCSSTFDEHLVKDKETSIKEISKPQPLRFSSTELQRSLVKDVSCERKVTLVKICQSSEEEQWIEKVEHISKDKEDGQRSAGKNWLELLDRKHLEEIKRKRALEAERKLVEQKKREKLREIEKKKEREEEQRKISRDSSRKRKQSVRSSSSSDSEVSSSRHYHSSKYHHRRVSEKPRSKSPGRRHKSRNRP